MDVFLLVTSNLESRYLQGCIIHQRSIQSKGKRCCKQKHSAARMFVCSFNLPEVSCNTPETRDAINTRLNSGRYMLDTTDTMASHQPTPGFPLSHSCTGRCDMLGAALWSHHTYLFPQFRKITKPNHSSSQEMIHSKPMKQLDCTYKIFCKVISDFLYLLPPT